VALGCGDGMGDSVGIVGRVGDTDGTRVGKWDGDTVGNGVGATVGETDGKGVGNVVGNTVGVAEGNGLEGTGDGADDGIVLSS